MLEQFNDLEDRYEKEFKYNSNSNSNNILVSIDKNEVSDLTETILNHINNNLEKIIDDTLSFFNDNKKAYEVTGLKVSEWFNLNHSDTFPLLNFAL